VSICHIDVDNMQFFRRSSSSHKENVTESNNDNNNLKTEIGTISTTNQQDQTVTGTGTVTASGAARGAERHVGSDLSLSCSGQINTQDIRHNNKQNINTVIHKREPITWKKGWRYLKNNGILAVHRKLDELYWVIL
jgi:hypothetical protein